MTTFLETGTKRLIYQSQEYAAGLTVTCYIWDPSLSKSALQTFTEVSDGFYYLDWNFSSAGVWFGKFYEDGTAKTSGVFRVEEQVIEGTITLKQAQRLMLSVLTGKSSGGGTSVLTFRDTSDSKDRLQVTVDTDGNRTAVGTRDAT